MTTAFQANAFQTVQLAFQIDAGVAAAGGGRQILEEEVNWGINRWQEGKAAIDLQNAQHRAAVTTGRFGAYTRWR